MAKKQNNKSVLIFGGLALLYFMRPRVAGSVNPGKPTGSSTSTGGIVSKYYTIDDVQRSKRATDDGISEQFAPLTALQIRDINAFIRIVLDPLTEKLGHKLDISSWWRSKRLNTLVGGEDDSLHLLGVAVDFKNLVGGVIDNKAVIRAMYDLDLPFTELVLYGSKTKPSSLHLAFDYKRPVEKQILFKKPEGGYETLSNQFIYQNFIAA